MIIIDNIRLRGLLHRRIRETAKILGMHYGTLSKKLAGESEWTIGEINRIEEEAGIKTDEFVKIKMAEAA